MKKLSLVALDAAVMVIGTGCGRKRVVVEERYEDNYDDYGRPTHDRSTVVKKDGKTVKYVQKASTSHKPARTHVEID